MAMTWRGVMAPLNQGDSIGRRIPIKNIDTDSRKMPIPFRWRPADFGGHTGAVAIGMVDRAWIEGGKLWGEGRFDDEDANARTVFSKIKRRFLRHISVDLEPKTNKLMAATVLDVPAFEEAEVLEIHDTEDGPEEQRLNRSESMVFAVGTMDDEHVEWGIDPAVTAVGPEDDDEYDITTFAVEAEYAYQQYIAGTFREEWDDEGQFANWIERVGGHLPRYVKRIAKHLQRKGFSESHSIATAISTIKRHCSTGDASFPGVNIVNAASRAEACAAVAEWNLLKAKARAT